tara:strand:+ start:578 stop:844 length:267 start_codon:yes stop_codon:yes gene_type:complete
MQFIAVIIFALFSMCSEIHTVNITLLELDDDCMEELIRVDNKWKLYKVELAYIEWLCRVNKRAYRQAVNELQDSLSHDLMIVSKTCLI